MMFGKVTPIVKPRKMKLKRFYDQLTSINGPEEMNTRELLDRFFSYTEINFAVSNAGVVGKEDMEKAINRALKKKWVSETDKDGKTLYQLTKKGLGKYINLVIKEKERFNKGYLKTEKYRLSMPLNSSPF